MKILFAPIGHPREYDEVIYIVEKGREDRGEYKTNTSFKAIQNVLKVDRVIVYAGLSLCNIDAVGTKEHSALYLECSKQVKGLVKERLHLDEDSVLVAPNVYGNTFIQRDRRTTLYFNYVYYNTLKIVEESKPDEVYIDITYGINYMPLLATEAIRLASYVYAIGKELTISIYQSEPVIKGNEGPYYVGKVFEEKVDTRLSLLSILTPFLQSNVKNVVSNTLSKELECDKDLLFSSANALFSGIFLFLLQYKDEIMKCLEKVEQRIKVLDYSQPLIKLAVEGKSVVYENKMYVELSYLHALLKVLSKIVENVQEKCVRLSDIRDLAEKFYTSESIRSVVLNEIDKLEKIKDKLSPEPKLLAEIILQDSEEGQKRTEKKGRCVADKRNLFAHGGFEQNVTYLWKSGDEICVSYGECIENVKKHLK